MDDSDENEDEKEDSVCRSMCVTEVGINAVRRSPMSKNKDKNKNKREPCCGSCVGKNGKNGKWKMEMEMEMEKAEKIQQKTWNRWKTILSNVGQLMDRSGATVFCSYSHLMDWLKLHRYRNGADDCGFHSTEPTRISLTRLDLT